MGQLVFQATLGGAVNLIGPNIAGTVSFTLPSADGTSGQAVSTNGSGVLSFGTLAVTAGGTGVTTSTGSGNNVLSTSPTLVTPTLGVATATSLQGIIGNVTPAAGTFTTVTGSNDASINGLTVGRGAGAVSTNTAVGTSALAANTSGSVNAAFGNQALFSNTTSSGNDAFGSKAAYATTTGSFISAFGHESLLSNTTGSSNSAMGFQALYNNTTASNNTAVGYQAGYSNTTGSEQTFIGQRAGSSVTTGNYNVAIGASAYRTATTGSDNVTVGTGAQQNGLVGNQNTAVGNVALQANAGSSNSALGFAALLANTTGNSNTSVGRDALLFNTTASNNTAVGRDALLFNTTASNNTAVGYQAGYSNTTGSGNTFLGYQTGFAVTTSNGQTFIGQGAGASKTTGGNNTFVGTSAGGSATTGTGNTFIGVNDATNGSGFAVTTGSKNTIIGGYSGNQGGLDIRTASNYIVLSDGDGNPRIVTFNSGNVGIGTVVDGSLPSSGVWIAPSYDALSASGIAIGHATGSASGNTYMGFLYNSTKIGSITQSGTAAVLYNVTSDQRLKENIVDAPEFGSVIDSIQVRSFDWKTDNTHQRAGFIAQELVTVAPEAVHQPTDAEEMMAVDYSKLVPMLVKEVQSLRKRLADAGL
jgi:hypothetical protein